MNSTNRKTNSVTHNPWEKLKAFTDARIAIGRVGSSLPTSEMLKFQLEHAQARDAVHLPLNPKLLKDDLNDDSILVLQSQAKDRGEYLQRPYLGRTLHAESIEKLTSIQSSEGYDLAIVCVDGLSSVALQTNAVPFINELMSLIQSRNVSLNMAPPTICLQGRVAIGDHIAEVTNAKTVLVLVGERPGLSSPDSMGLYLTYNAKKGCNDSQRNCVSNIRKGGLSYSEAAIKALYLIEESRRLQLSGVDLKERSEAVDHMLTSSKSFLTGE